jgi:AGZA family xanthine/uracil permease-like MFS transporter
MAELAEKLGGGGGALDSFFRFRENRTSLWRDTVAGATTFVVMSYIIFVNPGILTSVPDRAGAPLPFDAVLTSTCLVAGVMTIIMGLYTNRAFAIAPGLGLNATVAFSLVAAEGLSFAEAMGIIVMEGLLVTALVLVGMREAVMAAIPLELKKAIAVGIGLFIAFIGLDASGLLVRAEAGAGPPVALADFVSWNALIVIFGLVITIVLRANGFPGDLLVGIVATTILATIVNVATDYTVYTAPTEQGWARWPGDIVSAPDFGLVGHFSFDAFATAGVLATLAFVFSLFLADFFDTMGTLVGVGRQAGYLTERGELPEVRKPLLVDSVAAVAGGAASSSSATTYIESAAGVGVGGRTGWVSVVTGVLFFPFLFLSPLIGMVPRPATAPALLIVGWLMISVLAEHEEDAEEADERARDRADEDRDRVHPERVTRGRRAFAGIDFRDIALGLSAAVTIMFMPFTFSITDGIAAGFIVYVIVRMAQRRWAQVHPLMYVAAGLFALYFLVPLLQEHVI